MDEKAKEILARIETELAALREKLDALEEEVASCRAAVMETAGPDDLPGDASAPETEPVPPVAPAPVDLSDVIDLPDLPEDLPEAVSPEAPAEGTIVEEAAIEDIPEGEVVEDALEDTPMEEMPVEQAPAEEKAVEEAPAAPERELRRLSGEYRWQKDRPGAPVRNIRSGISLYDRALFINILFKEDYARYDETIAALNACNGLDEAVDYLVGAFPDWNWSSDAVYAFMMSIRKKLG